MFSTDIGFVRTFKKDELTSGKRGQKGLIDLSRKSKKPGELRRSVCPKNAFISVTYKAKKGCKIIFTAFFFILFKYPVWIYSGLEVTVLKIVLSNTAAGGNILSLWSGSNNPHLSTFVFTIYRGLF